MNASKIAFAAGLIAVSTLQARANLLLNPGAETGDLTGWTVGGPSTAFVDNGSFDPGINPHTGSFDFVGGGGGTSGASGSLTQNVSIASLPGITPALIDAGGTDAAISFWEQGLNQGDSSDHAFVTLTFRDASNNPISSISSPSIDSHDLAWQEFSGSFPIPAETRSIDYSMEFVREVGSDLDGFVDDNNLDVVVVPEPAGLLILASGASALLLRKNTRRAR